MVRYTGRARQLTRGNAGQNQKMSGSAGGVGRSYIVLGNISKRVTPNLTNVKKLMDLGALKLLIVLIKPNSQIAVVVV